MPFPIVVEDGTGLTNSNSYVSVVDADAVITLEPTNTAKWIALTTDDKAKMLVWATRWLDDRATWMGKRVTDPLYPGATPTVPAQALSWPRKNAFDRDGHAVSQTIVPPEVKRATALIANHFLNNADDDAALQAGLRRFRTDTFELEYQQGFFQSPVPPWIKFVLNGLGMLNNEAGFKKIRRV